MANFPDFNELWDYSNPEETRIRFENFLNEYSSDLSLDHFLQVKTQEARTYSLQAQFEEAHKLLDDLEPKMDQNTQKAQVRYYLERGRIFNSSGKKDLAIDQFIKAFELGSKNQLQVLAVDAAHMLAIASSSLEDKIHWNEKGLFEAKNSVDPKVKNWEGVFLNNMGWELFENQEYEKALEKFEACGVFYEGVGLKDKKRIADWSIAKTYRMLKKTDEALRIQMKFLEESGGEDRSGYTYEELGELFQVKGEFEKSKEFFSKAYELLSQDLWLQKNESARLARIKRIINDDLPQNI